MRINGCKLADRICKNFEEYLTLRLVEVEDPSRIDDVTHQMMRDAAQEHWVDGIANLCYEVERLNKETTDLKDQVHRLEHRIK